MPRRFSIACAAVVALLSGGRQAEGQLVSVATDRPRYLLGEPVDVLITAHNESAQPLTLHFSSTLQALYIMDWAYVSPLLAFQILTEVTIPPASDHTWTLRHDMSAYRLGVGTHSVVGRVVGIGDLPSANFTVLGELPADADRDGRVDFADFQALERNFGLAGGWGEGDFDGDGTVGAGDFTILREFFGRGLPAGGAIGPADQAYELPTAVPEPGLLSALGVAWVVSLGRHPCRRLRRSPEPSCSMT